MPQFLVSQWHLNLTLSIHSSRESCKVSRIREWSETV